MTGELIDAAGHLIDNPKAEDSALMDFVAGPDFPTGGVLVDSRETIASAYATGRGSFRLRASISIEREKGGGWYLLVSEMPYGVQKSRLIEQIAALIADKKLPIEQTSNDLVDISATVILDKDQIKQELGSDLGGDIVVVRVTVRPVSRP